MTRRTLRIAAVVDYWQTAAPAVFPNLHSAAIGWGEPFCFRCGWLAPVPADCDDDLWVVARSWLELAHLHNHAAGGSGDPSNVVPLCALCHRAMPPSMNGNDRAIAWVNALGLVGCDPWWQLATDAGWGGDEFRPYPGWDEFFAYQLHVQEVVRRRARATASSTG
ncbi:HNH endonuclease [Micromonospora sp. ATA32]|nr:HNH endonuclease [Micromonospora sp. ATA32]